MMQENLSGDTNRGFLGNGEKVECYELIKHCVCDQARAIRKSGCLSEIE